MRSASATSSFSSPLRSRPNTMATVSPAATRGAISARGLGRRRRRAWPGRGRARSSPARSCSRRSRLRACRKARRRRGCGRRRPPSSRALSFGQPCRGLTRRSRDRPKFAMARAAAPIFSPSCGSTSTTTGAGPARSSSWSCRCRRRACSAPRRANALKAQPLPKPAACVKRRHWVSQPRNPHRAARLASRESRRLLALLTRLLPTECGCYRARAELPSVEFPVGDVRAENNSFEGPREKPFHRARQCSVSGRPKQARRPEVQACQISKSCGQRSMKPRRSRPIPCCRSSKPSWARRACP